MPTFLAIIGQAVKGAASAVLGFLADKFALIAAFMAGKAYAEKKALKKATEAVYDAKEIRDRLRSDRGFAQRVRKRFTR